MSENVQQLIADAKEALLDDSIETGRDYRLIYRLARALEAAEAERDAALAVIAEALAATKRGNLMTPPWVISALSGEVTG